MNTTNEKGQRFRALHEQRKAFMLANAWDAGSARLLEAAGAEAIGTTSAGFAFSMARQDNNIGREAILKNATEIASATDLPVSADLEDGFGAAPESVAETIALAGEIGLAGGSIEDSTYDDSAPLYEIALATDRIAAAVETAQSLPTEFTLTARAENFLVGKPDLADAIERIQAYQEAGADVLYIPGLVEAEDIRTVLSSIDRPLNVLVGLSSNMPNLATLRDLGVARISIGSAFARLAYGQAFRAVGDILESEDFSSIFDAMPYGEISKRFS